MNKLSIATAITLASIAFVSAEETNVKKPVQVKPQGLKQMMKQEGRDVQMQNIKTGDAAIDAQLKTLNDEMEAKIKAIRDEYVLKIKAIVGDKAISPRMMREENGEKRGSDEGRKIGVPFRGDDLQVASGTQPRPMMRAQEEGGQPRPLMRSQNENVENNNAPRSIIGNENEQGAPAPIAPRVMNFFRGIFGGNK